MGVPIILSLVNLSGIGKLPRVTENLRFWPIQSHGAIPAFHGRQAIGGLQVTATELNGDRTSIRFFRRQIVQRKFMILTAIFMALSVSSLSLYAALASRAKGLLVGPELSRWVSRVVEVTFIGFGAATLAIRRQTA